ncbi:hypothetical protein M3J09_008528 [Ascochyta lentis]
MPAPDSPRPTFPNLPEPACATQAERCHMCNEKFQRNVVIALQRHIARCAHVKHDWSLFRRERCGKLETQMDVQGRRLALLRGSVRRPRVRGTDVWMHGCKHDYQSIYHPHGSRLLGPIVAALHLFTERLRVD